MTPVLLVHGYLATPQLMRPLRRRLRALGHDTYLAPELSPLVIGDVRAHAAELDRAVDRVRAQTGVDRIDVVGASQGGIIALWWAHAENGWDRVNRLVGLGTPYRGSGLARAAAPVLGLASAGVRQLVPESPFLEALTAIPLERPVFTVSMRGDPVVPPESAELPGMRPIVVDRSFGPMTHQLMMLDPRCARAVHEALTCSV